MPCFDTAGARNDLWGRPIEGLPTAVDLNEGRVVAVVDTGVVPVPEEAPHHGEEADRRPALRAVVMGAPKGADLTMEGGAVTWRNRSFHLRLEWRVGSVVSLEAFDDGEGPRSVASEITPSEVFVPSMAPVHYWDMDSR